MVIDKQIRRFEKEIESIPNLKIKKDLLEIIIIWIGPSVWNPNLAFFDFHNQEEIKKVKTHFLIGKLGLKDSTFLDESISKVASYFIQNKLKSYRVLFYYFLMDDLDLGNKLLERSKYIESESKIDYKLIEFGESLIRNQKDIDLDLKKILDDNFSNLI